MRPQKIAEVIWNTCHVIMAGFNWSDTACIWLMFESIST